MGFFLFLGGGGEGVEVWGGNGAELGSINDVMKCPGERETLKGGPRREKVGGRRRD